MLLRSNLTFPVEQALSVLDWHIIDAGMPLCHQACLVKTPVFIPVRSPPLALPISPLINKADGDPVLVKCPKLLNQPILTLLLPFSRQECLNFRPPVNKLIPVSPTTVGRIGQRNCLRILTVPGIFSRSNFLKSGVPREWGHRRTRLHVVPFRTKEETIFCTEWYKESNLSCTTSLSLGNLRPPRAMAPPP